MANLSLTHSLNILFEIRNHSSSILIVINNLKVFILRFSYKRVSLYTSL